MGAEHVKTASYIVHKFQTVADHLSNCHRLDLYLKTFLKLSPEPGYNFPIRGWILQFHY